MSDFVLDQCTICQQAMKDEDEDLDDTCKTIHKLPCNHKFHCACIAKWLSMCSQQECPICRKRTRPEEEEEASDDESTSDISDSASSASSASSSASSYDSDYSSDEDNNETNERFLDSISLTTEEQDLVKKEQYEFSSRIRTPEYCFTYIEDRFKDQFKTLRDDTVLGDALFNHIGLWIAIRSFMHKARSELHTLLIKKDKKILSMYNPSRNFEVLLEMEDNLDDINDKFEKDYEMEIKNNRDAEDKVHKYEKRMTKFEKRVDYLSEKAGDMSTSELGSALTEAVKTLVR